MIALRFAIALLFLLLSGLLVGCGSSPTSRLINIASPEIVVSVGETDDSLRAGRGGGLKPGRGGGLKPGRGGGLKP